MSENVLPDTCRFAGVTTTAELAAAGLSAAQVRNLVRRGSLVRVHRGVYVPARSAAQWTGPGGEQALLVAGAVAVSGPDSVGSHSSAAVLHGLDLLDRSQASAVTVTRPRASTHSRTARPGIRVCAAELPRSHVTFWHGIPVTTVARTVVDLARGSSLRSGVAVADSALHGEHTSKADLRAVIADCSRWPGVGRARWVVAFSDDRSESVFESVCRVAFHEQGLPPPDLQVWVGDDDTVVGRVDFLWKEFRTIGEADGAVKYADPASAMAQLRRDARLREAGFEVVHFTWREIALAPGQVAESIRAAFRRGRRN